MVVAAMGCGKVTPRPAASVGASEHRHITTTPQRIDLVVKVRPSAGADPRIEFEVTATSDDLPRRWVVQKKWAGDEEVLEHLTAPRVECDGRDADVTVDDLDTHMGWATPARCKTAIARYVVRPAKPGLDWGYEFDVVVSKELAMAIAETTLLLPDVPDETSARVKVDFDLSMMPSSEGVYSLGDGVHDTTTRSLRHAYFAMGRFATIKHEAGNLTLEARVPVGANFDLAAASRDLFRLLDAESKIFSDERHESLRLLLVGMPPGGGAHGTSLTASAVVWRDKNAPWSADDARLTAHEMFHLYNGQIIERRAGVGTDAETYWFSEGFTEHYTDELMRRSGVWRARDWVEAVRDRLRRYHRHPDCETPNDKADMRWGGPAVQLPYLRGSMVAAYIDAEMRRRTGGKKSLDDFMRMLLIRARNHEPPVDPEAMVQLLTREAGEEIGAMVRAVALGGKRLSLAPDAFGACVEVTGTGSDQDIKIKPGVDVDACMRAGG